jgi:opacity protein-like surface antigen
MRQAGVITLGLLFFLAATVGSAQRHGGLREVRGSRGDRHSWGSLGFAVVGGTPVGQFGDFVNQNSVGGVNANLSVNLNRRGTVALRIDGAYLLYGSENRPLPLAGTGGLLAGDMNTAFYIASLRAGPEFVLGTGRVRPYIFGTAGVAYFATETSVGLCCGTTNYDDEVASFAGGGGLRVDLSRHVALDLGATFVRNGEVSYLREGDILSNPDGSFTFRPVRSEANLFALQLGLSFGL